MSEFYPPNEPAVVLSSDDLTITQFLFDTTHPYSPHKDDTSPIFIDGEAGTTLTFGDLKVRCAALAKSLKERYGIDKDDVVAISSPNDIDYPVIIWAVLMSGGIIATFNPILTSSELEYQIQVVKPKIVFAHASTLRLIEKVTKTAGLIGAPQVVSFGKQSSGTSFTTVDQLVEHGIKSRLPTPHLKLGPGEAKRKAAFLCFSSGTSGPPKAVLVSHWNIIVNTIQTALGWCVNQDYAPMKEQRFRLGDVCLGAVPFYHVYGILCLMHFMPFCAIPVVIMPQFNFEKMLQDIQQYKITHLLIVPPQATLLCKHPATKQYDLSSVHFCMVAAAPISAELTAQLLEILPDVQLGQGYGLTETTGAVTAFPVWQKVGTLGSAGTLVPGTVAKVVKPDGSLAKVGEPGELWIKGGQIALGYYNNEQATRECFIDGWLRTGDEVYFAENGDMFVVDRIKEILKVKGFQVSPAELEGHLLSHPDVSDVAVVGVPDDYAGELPAAFVVPSAAAANRLRQTPNVKNALEAEIKKHVSDVKTRYKWLDRVYFVEAIPKNPSGKILRRVLREHLRDILNATSSNEKARL